MNDIQILKKALARKHPCDECHVALERLEDALTESQVAFREIHEALTKGNVDEALLHSGANEAKLSKLLN